MNTKSIVLALLAILSTTTLAAADPDRASADARDAPRTLTLFTSAGYLATSGGNGGALATGVRWGIGRHFALGFDLGYGLMATDSPTAKMEDRWWFIPSMAVVLPARVGRFPLTFDIGAGLGLGTSSGYSSPSVYTSHPFSADWEFQLEPAVRAHVIAAIAVSRSLEIFTRAEAAALVLPHGSSPSVTDSTWMMFSVGTRFNLL
ncbi:MAG TPA: hypothetical protein VGH28_10185 [Polyangiaceae bacterium]|jgi:hypothetical protein